MIWMTSVLLALGPPKQVNILQAQEAIMTWKIQANGISSDRLGFIYIHTSRQLIKYSASGDSIYSWSNPLLGNLGRICTLDPLRTLVFLPDFNQIIFLDNTLSPLADPVNLDDAGFPGVTAAATSKLGGYWIFQGSSQQIIKIGADNRPITRSVPISISSGNADKAILIESDDKLLLVIPENEILEFDLFGSFIRKNTLPFNGFTIRNHEWFSFDTHHLYRKTGPLSDWERSAALPFPEPDEICPATRGWIIRYKEWVGWYQL